MLKATAQDSERAERRLLKVGVGSVLVSLAGTYLYFLSVYLVPAFALLLWWSARRFDRIPEPRPGAAHFGLWLATSALLVPIVALTAFLAFGALAPKPSGTDGGSIATGWPVVFAIVGSVLLVLGSAVGIAWKRSR